MSTVPSSSNVYQLPTPLNSKVKIYTGTASQELGAKVAKSLGLQAQPLDTINFANGETRVRVPGGEAAVQGNDTVIIQSTSKPANDTLMELMQSIDALRRAGAKSITVVMPHYGYARQDRRTRDASGVAAEPVTAKLVANMLQMAGATRVLTVDSHCKQLESFFDVPFDNLSAMELFAKEIKSQNPSLENVAICSPDHGGVERARLLCDLLGLPPYPAVVDKRRGGPNEAEALTVIGDVKGQDVYIVDDMIDTGGTIAKAAKMLLEKGAKSVHVVATHPILSGEAVDKMRNAGVTDLVTTDTIALDPKNRQYLGGFIKCVSIAGGLSDALRKIIVRGGGTLPAAPPSETTPAETSTTSLLA
jgi:ribose-phosphate pyrophosphokinase